MDRGEIRPPVSGEGERRLLRRKLAIVVLIVSISLLVVSLPQHRVLWAAFVPEIGLAAHAQPMAEVGGPVSYSVTLGNWGFGEAANVVVTHTLPAGFSYQAGSTGVKLDGEGISSADPDVDGQRLTWGPFALPAATGIFDNHYGIHTFVQDLCVESYVDFQLDRALELADMGGHVTQLLYPVTPSSTGPHPCWVYFVNGAYDRNLVPIVRLQGVWGGDYWVKPEPDSPGDYTSIAQAYKRVVQGLPRRDGRVLYVQVWNEPDLSLEWSGEPDAREYGNFFVDVAAAIHSMGDPRIQVLNGGLTPGNVSFTRQLIAVPGFAQSFDLWASHCYPLNHPPAYNIHNGTARYPQYTIDCYLLELRELATRGGRTGVKVMVTETGYGLYDSTFRFEGYPPINEDNRAYYIKRAFRDFWASWPEVVGVTPFELVDPYSTWERWDWLYPGTDLHHRQFTVVKALSKPEATEVIPALLTVNFQAQAAGSPGAYYSDVLASADDITISPLDGVAAVIVVDELHRRHFPLAARRARPGAHPESVGGSEDLAGQVEVSLPEPAPRLERVVLLNLATQVREAPTILDIIEVGSNPQGIALDSSAQRAYVTLADGVLVVIDTTDHRVICTARTGREPQAVAVNPSTGVAYVANSGEGSVSVVDGANCRLLGTIQGFVRPRGLAVDEAANRIYVTDAEAANLVVVEGEKHEVVATVPLGSYPDSVAYDPSTSQVYVADAGEGTLSVIDATSLEVISTVSLGPGPLLGMAIDGKAGLGYVVQLATPLRRGIAVVDLQEARVDSVLVGDEERPLNSTYAVAVDGDRGCLYIADGAELLVVDPWREELSTSLALKTVTYNFGLAADSTRRRVYLLDSASGRLFVIGY